MPPTIDDLLTRVGELDRSNRQLRLELSERAREEKALGNRVDELAAMNRELEAFSSSLLHDLRAPLRSIDGFSLALLEDCGDSLGEQGKDYLRRARAASERMEQMIDRLLDLARATRSEAAPVPVDLSGLSREIADELQHREPERQVEFSIQEGLGVNGDPQLLRMAMENLLGNAWKFTGRHAQARIEVGVTTGGDGPAYFVRDDGAGFDMAYVDKLFNAFQRVHTAEEFEGTGIGLATVRRVVLRHGGRVWAEGEVEKGATFYFTL